MFRAYAIYIQIIKINKTLSRYLKFKHIRRNSRFEREAIKFLRQWSLLKTIAATFVNEVKHGIKVDLGFEDQYFDAFWFGSGTRKSSGNSE